MKAKLWALAFGLVLAAGTAAAGPVPGGADTDGDTVEDAFDNCTTVANAAQADTDHDACGNSCDTGDVSCDWDNGTVGFSDFGILKTNFGMAVPPGTLGDCRGLPEENGTVGFADFGKLKAQYGMTAGPSGITNAQCDSTICVCTP